MIKCIGCGIEIQHENQDKTGYSPKLNAKYCKRCFKIKHYNNASVATVDKEKEEIINIIEKTNNHVIFVVDFLNINLEIINTFKQINNPKTLIVSKLDLMAKNIKLERIKNIVLEVYKLNTEILFISSLKKNTLRELTNYLNRNNYSTNYVVGYVNAGKSSLINALYELNNDEKSIITTSNVPNTTLDFITMKITDNLVLIDSPGFAMDKSLLNTQELIKKVNPKKTIKPITYQVKPESGIIIENNIKLFNETNIKNSWTFYMSNLIEINKIFKFEDKDYIIIDVPENSDLIIKGFGFINIKESSTIKISNLDKELIEVRKSIF